MLSGCGATRWAHSYKTEKDLNSDLATCRYLAVQVSLSYSAPMSDAWPDTMDNYSDAWNGNNSKTVKTKRREEERRCLEERGWYTEAVY